MSKLFTPITLKKVEFRNRLWVPPMCTYAVENQDGIACEWHLVHYGGLASGGAGGIIVEATGVVPEGRISPRDLGIWNDEQLEAFKPIVKFAHSQGAKIGVQLAHAGRKASTYSPWGMKETAGSIPEDRGGWQTFAPSPIANGRYAEPKGLDKEGIEKLIDAFSAAAKRAIEAGFDFVEVHAAHGYLLHEFLSPLSNHRKDEYGGRLENRARLLLQIVDAVRDQIDEVPLLVRLSATEWVEGGFSLEETIEVCRELEKHGVSLFDISSGGNIPIAPIPVGPGYQTPLAKAVKDSVSAPVAAVGMITDAVQAEQIVATGQADVVLVGRKSLNDPAFALHSASELGVQVSYVPGPYERGF